MDRESIQSLGQAYDMVQLSEEDRQIAEQIRAYLIQERIGLPGPLSAVFGVAEYHNLINQGYTPKEALAKAATMGLLGFGGGALGAKAGLLGGPAAPVPIPAPSIAGGMAAYEGGGALYDKLTGRVNGRVPGSRATLGGKPVVWSKDGKWVPADSAAASDVQQDTQTATETETQTATVPGSLPSDYKGTEAQAFQAADEFRQGAGTSALPAAVQPEVRAAAAQQDAVDAGQEVKDEPAEQPAAKLTNMQKWAQANPALAQRLKPGDLGYDEIKDMAVVRNATQPTVGGVERRTPGPLNNQPLKTSSSEASTPSVATQQQNADMMKKIQQSADKYKANLGKVNSGSQNMKTDIKTPGLRAASKLKDYSQKANNYTQGSKPGFAGIPEEYMLTMEAKVLTEINNLIEENQHLDYITEEMILERGGLFRMMGPAMKRLLRQAPKGWQWVVKNGKRVLEKLKGGKKPATPPTSPGGGRKPPTRPSTILGPDGKPLQRPVTAPRQRPQSGLNRPRPQGTGAKPKPGAKPQTQAAPPAAPTGGGGTARLLGGLGVTVGAGALTHDIMSNPDKYRDFFGLGPGGPSDTGGGPPGGSETVTDTETETITTQPGGPGGPGGTGPGGAGPKDPPGMSRNGGGLAAALRDTQNAITAERKRKEGANYSGPKTIKNPGKLQSTIGTDFSDVAEERKDERGLTANEKSIGRSIAAGMNPLTDHMAGATRQRLALGNRGVKKPKARSNRKETRLPAQQLKAMKNEEQALQDLTASLFEGLPEPKVNYLKDMDPYDPRRAPRDHAPGSPLPPPSMRPGLPNMKLAKKGKKENKTA